MSKSKVPIPFQDTDKIPHHLLRTLVDIYYDFQEQRIQTQLRIGASKRKHSLSEEDLSIFGITTIFENAQTFERDIEKLIRKQLRNHALYNQYLEKITGIGPMLGAGLIAYVDDIEKFDHVSSLWQYCYDEKTEVLTKSGFKYFSDVIYDDEIMTLNPETDEMIYQKPIGLFKIRYKGKMVNFSGRAYDYLVTPEHKMYVKHKYSKFMFVPAITIYEQLRDYPHSHVELKRDGIWVGKEIQSFNIPKVRSRAFIHPKSHQLVTHSDVINPENIKPETWLKFIGWYLTEGSCDRHGKRKIARVSIGQGLMHPENRTDIIQTLRKIGYSPYEGKQSIDVTATALYQYVKQFGNAYKKFIPNELKNLPPDKLRILIDTMMKGDGDQYGRLFTVSKRMADDFQEIVIKAGYASSIAFRGDGYRITIIKKQKTPLIQKLPKLIEYDGDVYDLSVPKYHILLVRRNGKTGWSSNCGYGMNRYCENCKKPTSINVEYSTGTIAKKLHPFEECQICQNKTISILQKRMSGYQSNWNDRLKVLSWKAGTSFVKQKATNSKYRKLYDKIKKAERRKHPKKIVKNSKIYYNDGHIHNRTMRKVVKIFLAHFWQTWRRQQGLEATEPYAKQLLGHSVVEAFVDK